MDKQTIEKKLAYLEFVNDQLSTEIEEVNQLLKDVGFPNGLASFKTAASEILSGQEEICEN